jgi:RNA polymerase sigma factor (sigma-70 family)
MTLGTTSRQLPRSGSSQSLDRQLLDRFVSDKDDAAFAALVQRHGPTVLRVCRGVLRDPHRAEDAFQATFLVLVRKARAIRKQKSVGSWLYKVAYRIALGARAGAVLRQSHETQAAGKEPTDLLTEITGRELVTALDEELMQMGDQYRAPLLLCCLEGIARDEAAQVLGWSLSTLKRRLERGRELLRTRLARRGLTLSAVLGATLLAQSATAAVPAALSSSTMHIVHAFVQGGSAAIAAPVATLADGAVQALSLVRLTLGLALFLAAAISCSLFFRNGSATRTPQVRQDPVPAQQPRVAPAAPERRVPARMPAFTTERYQDPSPGLVPDKKKPFLI